MKNTSTHRTIPEYLAPLTINDGVDAELAVVADAEFKGTHLHRTSILDRDDQSRHFGRRITEALIKYVALLRRGKEEDADQLLYLGKKLQRNLGKRVFETLIEGRLKIALLIDSDGGDIRHLKYFEDALGFWKDRGNDSTKVEAYVFGHAMSAGFFLMCEAENIAVLPRTELLWHFSGHSVGQRKSLVKSYKQNLAFPKQNLIELQGLVKFLRKNSIYAQEDFAIRKAREKILEDTTGQGDVSMLGAHCFKAEMVNEMYGDVISMARHFNARYRIALDPKVEEFWVLSAMAEDDVSSMESWRFINFEKMRAHKKKSSWLTRERWEQYIWDSSCVYPSVTLH